MVIIPVSKQKCTAGHPENWAYYCDSCLDKERVRLLKEEEQFLFSLEDDVRNQDMGDVAIKIQTRINKLAEDIAAFKRKTNGGIK